MSAAFKDRLLSHQDRLRQNLEVDGVLRDLYTGRTISRAEYDVLRQTVNTHGTEKTAFDLVLLLTKKGTIQLYFSFSNSRLLCSKSNFCELWGTSWHQVKPAMILPGQVLIMI